MVSEFDLPCTECGQRLDRATVATASDATVEIAECSNCGTRHYPKTALDSFRSRTRI